MYRPIREKQDFFAALFNNVECLMTANFFCAGFSILPHGKAGKSIYSSLLN
jgi:hypothetical protein